MKVVIRSVAVAACLALAACGTTTDAPKSGGSGSSGGPTGSMSPKDMTMVTVVKISGVGWFDRMDQGVKAYAKSSGVDARQQGADDASPEKQVQIIENLLPQKPTAITMVPNSPESLENVAKQARSQGIVVVSHEAAGMKNVDADIEAFDNKAYGATMMDNLGKCMGGEGQYVAMVGSLTANTHMEWVAGALAEAKSKFPNVKRVEGPIESKEDENVAYQNAKSILKKYPNIKGFEGSAGTDVAGIARAVQEAGLQDKTCVMGTSIPSVAKKYLSDGSIDKIFFWDPALAGEAQLSAATLIAEGKKIQAGTDLKVKGYDSLKPITGTTNAFAGDAAVIVDKTNVDQYKF